MSIDKNSIFLFKHEVSEKSFIMQILQFYCNFFIISKDMSAPGLKRAAFLFNSLSRGTQFSKKIYFNRVKKYDI